MVTGGAKRVGRAIVLELARGGCAVAVHYRNSEKEANDLVALVTEGGGNAMAVCGNLNVPSEWPGIVEACTKRLGRLDILVNNAALFLTPMLDNVDAFDATVWHEMLRTNLVAPMALAHHARCHLVAHGKGKIINLCDISADRPWPLHLAYCASKAGLVALTKGLAVALAPEIQVNGVAPGIAEFPDEYSGVLRDRLTSKVPLGRAGTPEEIARVVRFLAESGDYITGEIIRVDGGRSLV